MDNLPKIINQYPELLTVTRPSLKKCIFYSEERYDKQFIDALIQIYKFYYEIDITLFIPNNFEKYHTNSIVANLESLESIESVKDNVIVFAYSDIIFNDLIKINKKRINTILKKLSKHSKVIILSITNLNGLNLPVLELFETISKSCLNRFKNLNLSYFDLVDDDTFTFDRNLESFIETIPFNERVYISLNLPIKTIKSIESQLKDLGHKVFRQEPEENLNGIVLNTSVTTCKTLLKLDYRFYFFVLPNNLNDLDILNYFKDILTTSTQEVYIDSSNNEIVEESFSRIYNQSFNRLIFKDSRETFETLKSLNSLKSLNIADAIVASEEYYQIQASEAIKSMDLKNLTKRDYDTIRNFIKSRLISKFDLDIKTCQLTTPCSPKDRSRKLNSLSNKISSVDYRCDVTCEIFRDYSIGIVIWNEMFTKREKITCLKNETYIYQTTSGTWKYTKVY
jgi:hypothetical protein